MGLLSGGGGCASYSVDKGIRLTGLAEKYGTNPSLYNYTLCVDD